jgi:twitching motility protein PilT
MKKQEIDHILVRMLDYHRDVSDLNFTVGKPMQVESAGELIPVEIKPSFKTLTPFQTEILALNLINQDHRITDSLVNTGSCDLSYSLPGKARFRINIFSQGANLSIVLRKLESKIPTIAERTLPKTMYQIAKEINGIIFVTGATGSGKTTTLAAILDQINETKSVHIITLEDPVEYQHPHKKATFNQRELGLDFNTYANGLRAALRQAPKVILVGEMRDKETVEIGLSAAETGHLVFTTLHTVDAGSTVNRIIGMFPNEDERQIRIRLADSMRWIVCQRLLPQIGGGRVATFEIMGTNMRVQDTILHGEAEGKTFYDIMESSSAFGMTTFDQHLVGLFEEGLVTQQTAMTYASQRGIVGRGIDAIKSSRGETTTDIEKLEIDRAYNKPT